MPQTTERSRLQSFSRLNSLGAFMNTSIAFHVGSYTYSMMNVASKYSDNKALHSISFLLWYMITACSAIFTLGLLANFESKVTFESYYRRDVPTLRPSPFWLYNTYIQKRSSGLVRLREFLGLAEWKKITQHSYSRGIKCALLGLLLLPVSLQWASLSYHNPVQRMPKPGDIFRQRDSLSFSTPQLIWTEEHPNLWNETVLKIGEGNVTMMDDLILGVRSDFGDMGCKHKNRTGMKGFLCD
jgi:hypothetical protein